MSTRDRIRGKTLRFTFQDGQMAGKTFEHTFGADGKVTFRVVGEETSEQKAEQKSAATPSIKYEVATVRDDVFAVSYLSPQGYTLTTVLDFTTSKLVAFSSNDKMLGVQHGTFEEVGAPSQRANTETSAHHAHRPS